MSLIERRFGERKYSYDYLEEWACVSYTRLPISCCCSTWMRYPPCTNLTYTRAEAEFEAG